VTPECALGTTSPTDLTGACRKEIEPYNSVLNFFILLMGTSLLDAPSRLPFRGTSGKLRLLKRPHAESSSSDSRPPEHFDGAPQSVRILISYPDFHLAIVVAGAGAGFVTGRCFNINGGNAQ